MISLGLVGKHISHSKSEEIYRKILNIDFTYTLLDYSSAAQIPCLDSLFEKYDGISVTSPYKKHFLSQLELDAVHQELQVINCIKKTDEGKFQGINTDFLAIEEILNRLRQQFDPQVLLLGDGAMSLITQKLLQKKEISYQLISRSQHGEIEKINLAKICQDFQKTPLIINSCARNFHFSGELTSEMIFWDYNYDMKAHQSYVKPRVCQYLDGIELLELQARFAIKFWDIV